jgi:RimJ/RimL family protein N-acetyltransferase
MNDGAPPAPFGKIAIRRFERADAEQLYEAVHESVPDLTSWMVWCHHGYSVEDAANFVATHDELWERGERYDLAICHKETGTLLGSIGVSHLNRQHRCANVGYWVRTKWTKQGFAKAAIGLAAQFAFETLGLYRLEFLIQADNVASLHAAKGAGAVNEGVLRNRLALHCKLHDATVLSLIPTDLPTPQPNGDCHRVNCEAVPRCRVLACNA